MFEKEPGLFKTKVLYENKKTFTLGYYIQILTKKENDLFVDTLKAAKNDIDKSNFYVKYLIKPDDIIGVGSTDTIPKKVLEKIIDKHTYTRRVNHIRDCDGTFDKEFIRCECFAIPYWKHWKDCQIDIHMDRLSSWKGLMNTYGRPNYVIIYTKTLKNEYSN